MLLSRIMVGAMGVGTGNTRISSQRSGCGLEPPPYLQAEMGQLCTSRAACASHEVVLSADRIQAEGFRQRK